MNRVSTLTEIVRQAVARVLPSYSDKSLQDMHALLFDFEKWRRKYTLTGADYSTRCFVAGRCLSLTTELTVHRQMLGRIPPPFSKKWWWSISAVRITDSNGNSETCSLATLRELAAMHFWDFTLIGLWDFDEDWSDFYGIYWSEDLQEGRIYRNPESYSIAAGGNGYSYELIHAIPANLGEISAEHWLTLRRAAWIRMFC